jgi:hypothetical protein
VPALSVTVAVTVNTPLTGNTCVGAAPLPADVPSPKFQE